MTTQSRRTARQLCGGRRGIDRGRVSHREFTEAERLFGEAQNLAEQDGDREAALEGLVQVRDCRIEGVPSPLAAAPGRRCS